MLSENRDYLVSKFGEDRYIQVYGALSSLACCSIGVGYFRFGRNQGPVIFRGAAGALPQAGAFVVQALGLVGFSQLAPAVQLPFAVTGMASVPAALEPHRHPRVGADAAQTAKDAATPLGLKARCPIDFDHSRRVEGKEGPSGAKLVTRHPMLWSMACVGVGAALGTPLATEMAFGLMPAAMAAIGGAHQDHRYRLSGKLSPAFEAATSHVPFVALVEGRAKWSDLTEEMAWTNAGIAVATAGLLARRRFSAARALLN